MNVDILPFRLQLASLDKSAIPRCTYQLMKLVLFPSGPRHFFSYAETDKEVSLILDESYVSGFPKGTLRVCSVIWRAVQIEPGESGLASDEVISRVSKPLADINVSIMQISTYDADFTLMPECDLQRALECLANILSISNSPFEDLGLQPSDLNSWEKSYPMSPSGVASLHDALLLDPSARERKFSLGGDSGSGVKAELDPSAISSLSLNDPEHSPKGSQTVKKARHPFDANYPHRADRFFSFTRTDNTLSMIMDDATMNLFPENSLNTHAGDWRLIAIGDGPLGFDECGIVSEFSRLLSVNGIGLFYLSTFSSDYIMVSDQDFEQAVACLRETARASDEEASVSIDPSRSTSNQKNALEDADLHSSGSESEIGSESEPESESFSEVDPEEYDDMDAKRDDYDDEVEIVFCGEGVD
ncbi:Cytosolic arginine sensor for mTORC1 subunit 2 [Entomortierella chlamydospora]|uniref:Cytosolic arginine sensor for mTORC1 subunit 2 n=1 Tax=Entomortierella chlamydospora TaxID=101097 RepID=A0A9P6T2K9_9FUNG|nr:Cytosolic arginine sensor for mTORC1 subunit 2 [Entomortierella chlamydospora]